ncbi:hypothetical protein [Caballeronia hypogeia]|uniref:hypothetical protein n=1 Tax=Caballeronia hypogeia TaxID=1777140 RepID=UPI0009EF467D|nr:hypothetical protein [Caballeronia hypogeia]
MQTDVLRMARKSGMTVLLDGRIGQQAYTSVSGSADALQKFAHDVEASLLRTHQRRRARAARSPEVNPLVTARMRERIAAFAYRGAKAPRWMRPARHALSRPASISRRARG